MAVLNFLKNLDLRKMSILGQPPSGIENKEPLSRFSERGGDDYFSVTP